MRNSGVEGPLLAALLVATLPLLPGVARAESAVRARFLCKGRFDASEVTALFFNARPATVVLLEGEQAIRLPIAISASGARYSDGSTTFWVKGSEATWERGPQRTLTCELQAD